MADTMTTAGPTRRDFLFIATGAVGAVGAGAAIWPLISQMNPDASTLALSTVEVDIGPIAEGQSVRCAGHARTYVAPEARVRSSSKSSRVLARIE